MRAKARLKIFVFLFLFISMLFFGNYILASAFETPGIFFSDKRPSVDENIENSLAVYANPVEVLKNDALAIPKLKGHFYVKIVGYTDKNECVGSGCSQLSLRRAQMIYKWMLAHGVRASQLFTLEGHGSENPVGDNNTSDGRARNRRVEFQWVPISPAS